MICHQAIALKQLSRVLNMGMPNKRLSGTQKERKSLFIKIFIKWDIARDFLRIFSFTLVEGK